MLAAHREAIMPVELGYFTLSVADLARGKVFYGALFGWQFEEGGHVANTKFPLGITGGKPGDYSTTYFKVQEMDRMVQRVEQLGGKVHSRNIYPSGPSAVCEDDQGTVFCLWQPAPGYED
jgi:uncharacterized protein